MPTFSMAEGSNRAHMQYRNSPIQNWVDHNSRHRIVNQIIYEELYNSGGGLWERKVAERLGYFGIRLSESTIRGYVRQIGALERDPVCASAFSDKSPNGLASRSGKEVMYGQLDLLEHAFLSSCGLPLLYVGLPANQILSVIRKYGGKVWACERNPKMLRFMQFLKGKFFSESPARVIGKDIFEFLSETEERFTVFDVDLMLYMREQTIAKLAAALNRAAGQRAVVSIASCIGRKITEGEYKRLMPSQLVERLEFRVLASYSGGYCDHVAPMRYELIAMERK